MTGDDTRAAIRKQNDEALSKACLVAGIGRRYHGMTLSSVAGGEQILALYGTGSLHELVRQGKGVGFSQGAGGDSRALAIMVARALVISGVSCLVDDLVGVVDRLMPPQWDDESSYSAMSRLYEVDYLTILDFHSAGFAECPLSPRERQRVCSLLARRSDQGKSTSVHTRSPNMSDMNRWWPDATISLLNLLNVRSS